MHIQYKGPDGATIRMDIPKSVEKDYKKVNKSGLLDKMLEKLAMRFYTTIVLGLMGDLKLIIEGGLLPTELVKGEEAGMQMMLHRLHQHLDEFAERELALTPTAKKH